MRGAVLGLRQKKPLLSLAILAITAGALGFWYWQSKSPAERATEALVEAYSKGRLIEARLSGGFRAGVYDQGADQQANIDKGKLKAAAEYLQSVESYDAETNHALGRMLLASRDAKKAIIALRPLASDRGASAELHNDFGACLLEQGETEGAIDAFNRALEKSPAMPEALFNRAISYQRLQLRDAARDDLARLLGVESDDGWAAESRRRLNEVTRALHPKADASEIVAGFDSAIKNGQMDEARKIASQLPDKLRERGLGPLIKEYIQAVRAADAPKAERAIREIELIGNLLVEIKGDKEIADFAHFIRLLSGAERAPNLDLIDQCITAIDAHFDGKQPRTALEFEGMEKAFARRGNVVFEVISGWMVNIIHYNFNLFNESIKPLERILPIVLQRGWQYQQARVLGQLGIAYSRIGNVSTAINHSKQSLAITSKFPSLHPKALQVLALPYWHLGDLDTATSYCRNSNTLYLEEGAELNELSTNYLYLADIYRIRDRHELALLFAQQALRFAEEGNYSRFAAQASSLAAIEQAQLKMFDQANESIRVAFDHLSKVNVNQARDYNRPLVFTRAGEVAARQGEIDRALEYYSEAESIIAKVQEKIIPMIRMLDGRADALLSSGRFDEARSDLDRAIDLIENYRYGIVSGQQRSYFLDASNGVFDQAIALNMRDATNWVDAFNYSERAHARTLLERMSADDSTDDRSGAEPKSSHPESLSQGERGKPLELQAIIDALPPDQGVLQYAVTSQGTYIFLVTRSGLEVVESRVTTEKLDSLVDTYLSELRASASSTDKSGTNYLTELAGSLYRDLIGPVESRLGNLSSLCIVPDKSLHFLPFAALVDGQGKFLIKTYTLSYAPSSTVLVRCIKRRASGSIQGAEKIVSVGNPTFDAAEFPGLKDLPDAAKEAEETARLYGPSNSLVLLGPVATKARILDELKDCHVAHLALHCLVRDNSPWRAALVVAPTKNPSGATTHSDQSDSLLTLEEMYRLNSPRMRLAVLSACESGLGQYHRGEGVVSLVRPFIASEVPTVVASLWQVDSRATRDLMVEFHNARKSLGAEPGEALRTAQMRMASSGYYQHPYFWASFIVIGSS
jgi:CHAT domain-containing protein/predicted negative regulator of RcsB-dependent stress response